MSGKEISAKLVKELRDKTNSGMMDCKKALAECDCDLEKAIDWLRQKGLMTARKRAGRATREGLVVAGVSADGKKGAVVELNCETDFVAKNEGFQKLAQDILAELLSDAPAPADNEELLKRKHGGQTLDDTLKGLVGTIGENMNLRRFAVIQAGPGGFVHTYIHGQGRLGVMVEMFAEKVGPAADSLAHDVAMHIAAANPMALNAAGISAEVLEREKAVAKAKLADSGKPENMWDKIVEGQMKKFYSEVALLEQAFVKDPSKNVQSVLKDAAGECGTAEIKCFHRFQLGEEIEGEPKDEE